MYHIRQPLFTVNYQRLYSVYIKINTSQSCEINKLLLELFQINKVLLELFKTEFLTITEAVNQQQKIIIMRVQLVELLRAKLKPV